jgi:hypothetical protein
MCSIVRRSMDSGTDTGSVMGTGFQVIQLRRVTAITSVFDVR